MNVDVLAMLQRVPAPPIVLVRNDDVMTAGAVLPGPELEHAASPIVVRSSTGRTLAVAVGARVARRARVAAALARAHPAEAARARTFHQWANCPGRSVPGSCWCYRPAESPLVAAARHLAAVADAIPTPSAPMPVSAVLACQVPSCCSGPGCRSLPVASASASGRRAIRVPRATSPTVSPTRRKDRR